MSTYLSPNFDPENWISQAEAARIRGVSRQAIAKLVAASRLATFRIGGRKFVSKSDVLRFEALPAGRPKVRPRA
ncbi:MAG: helix-turn-helix domain-containing protein [Steroidobacteraceae bacterium]